MKGPCFSRPAIKVLVYCTPKIFPAEAVAAPVTGGMQILTLASEARFPLRIRGRVSTLDLQDILVRQNSNGASAHVTYLRGEGCPQTLHAIRRGVGGLIAGDSVCPRLYRQCGGGGLDCWGQCLL